MTLISNCYAWSQYIQLCNLIRRSKKNDDDGGDGDDENNLVKQFKTWMCSTPPHKKMFFQESSKQLTGQKPTVVDPKGLLYVGQREYGGTSPDDGKRILFSNSTA